MMDRRTFGKAFGAAIGSMLLPGLLVNPSRDLHSLLLTFCDNDRWTLYDLTKPYLVEGHAYGTNGHVMARIASDRDESDNISKKRPDFTAVWSSNRSKQLNSDHRLVEFKYDPSIAVAGGFRCAWCLSRRVPAPKEMSDRLMRIYAGEEKFDTAFVGYAEQRGLSWDDEEPFTVFDESCSYCKGVAVEMGSYPIGDAKIDVLYASKIASIPGVRIAVPDKFRDGEPLYFHSEIGIEGMVMPFLRYP